MPKTTEELVALLDLEEIEIGLYRGRHPETSWQRTFGGQVLGQSLMAAYKTAPPGRVAHSLHGYFLRPGKGDAPIIYHVETLRDGRSFSVRRVLARQGGATIFGLSTSFHVLEEGIEHSDRVPPGVPEPGECPSLADVLAERFGSASPLFRQWEALDVRFAGDSSGAIPAVSHGAHMRVWVRTTEALPDDQPTHQAVLAYLSDMTILSVATVPHEITLHSPFVQAASLDHTLYFHRPVRADQWILYDQVSPSASQALGFGTGRLFQDGALIGSCSQEGLIRILPESHA